jgi:hypothetical protein
VFFLFELGLDTKLEFQQNQPVSGQRTALSFQPFSLSTPASFPFFSSRNSYLSLLA